jgi:hypothetical protein
VKIVVTYHEPVDPGAILADRPPREREAELTRRLREIVSAPL